MRVREGLYSAHQNFVAALYKHAVYRFIQTMNTTNYTTTLSAGTSNGSEGWPTMSVSRRDAVWLLAGFGFGALTTMGFVLACSRCRRHRRRRDNTESSEGDDEDTL